MTDIISAICDDIDNYVSLCAKYGHKVRSSENGSPDCYGAHAKKLERREKGEVEKKKGNGVPIETEVKLRVNEDVICRLEKELGCTWKSPSWERQENIIYRSGEGFVRFRRERGEVTLTIKGKRLPGKYNERPEIECELPREFFDQIWKSKETGAVVYEKQRASFDYNGCTVCLDNLYGKYFVEIEGKRDRIEKSIVGLRLKGFPRVRKDYAQIVQEMLRK
jgi:adenylate cyclase class IV